MTATIKPTIPEGVIRAQDVDADFSDFVAGRPLTRRMLLVEVEVGAVKSDSLERGRVTGCKYTIIHAAEVRDTHEADITRHRILQIRGEGGFYAKQPALFDATDAEKRESLLDLIKDFASEHDMPMADLDRRWQDLFGETESASKTIQASRSLAHMSEFALLIGAVEDKKAGEKSQDLDGSEQPDDEPEDQPEDEEPSGATEPSPEPTQEPAEALAPGLRSVPFQEQA